MRSGYYRSMSIGFSQLLRNDETRGLESESESLIRRRVQLRALSVSCRLLCHFVAAYLTFVQFILQLSPRVGLESHKKPALRIPG